MKFSGSSFVLFFFDFSALKFSIVFINLSWFQSETTKVLLRGDGEIGSIRIRDYHATATI